MEDDELQINYDSESTNTRRLELLALSRPLTDDERNELDGLELIHNLSAAKAEGRIKTFVIKAGELN